MEAEYLRHCAEGRKGGGKSNGKKQGGQSEGATRCVSRHGVPTKPHVRVYVVPVIYYLLPCIAFLYKTARMSVSSFFRDPKGKSELMAIFNSGRSPGYCPQKELSCPWLLPLLFALHSKGLRSRIILRNSQMLSSGWVVACPEYFLFSECHIGRMGYAQPPEEALFRY